MHQLSIKTHKLLYFIYGVINKPGLFSVTRIEDINIMTYAFIMALNIEEAKSVELFLYKFRVFLNKKYTINNNLEWVKIVRLHSNNDTDSIKKLELLINEFLILKYGKDLYFFYASWNQSPSNL